jgi:NTE family protein
VSERAKDIQYSSRTRAITNLLADRQKHALFIKNLLAHVPADVRKTDPLFRLAEEAADGSSINVVHLIYKNKPYEGHYKDYEFSIDTMEEHWKSGLEDIGASFAHPDWFEVPSRERGFVTHDVHRQDGSVPQSDRSTLELPTEVESRVAA